MVLVSLFYRFYRGGVFVFCFWRRGVNGVVIGVMYAVLKCDGGFSGSRMDWWNFL